MLTDPMTSVRTTIVMSSKHLQYHTLSGQGIRDGTGGDLIPVIMAAALASVVKETFWEQPGIHPLNALQGLVAYCHTAEQIDFSNAFICLLMFHRGAQGIHLVTVVM